MLSKEFPTSNQYIVYTIEVTQKSQDKDANTSSVNVKVRFWRTNHGYETYGTGTVYCTIDGKDYSASVGSGQRITEDGIVLFNQTVTINHETSGAKTLKVVCWIDHQRVTSGHNSFSVTLTTIPRASKLSVSAVNLGEPMAINITRYDPNFTDTVRWVCGTQSGTVADQTSQTSLTWTPALDLSAQNVNGDQVTLTLYCDTSNNGAAVGQTVTTLQCKIPDSVVPKIEASISDESGSYEKYGCFLQGYSRMRLEITAVGLYGATIVSYLTSVDGKNYNGATISTAIITSHGTISANITVRDSRGRTATLDYTFEVLEYTAPVVSAVRAFRCDKNGHEYYQGDFCKVIFSAGITTIDGRNNAKYRIEYKKQTDVDYTSMDLPDYAGMIEVEDGEAMFAVDNTSSYNIYVYAADDFAEIGGYVFSPSVFRLIHFGPDGQALAFFKRCESKASCEFGRDVMFSGGYVPVDTSSLTDLDELIQPGWYVSNGGIGHAPTFGDFCIEVSALDSDGAIMQCADWFDGESAFSQCRYRHNVDGDFFWTEWGTIYAKPDHKHDLAGDSITGTLPIKRGGTNASTAKDALANLGIIYCPGGVPSSGNDGEIYLVPV